MTHRPVLLGLSPQPLQLFLFRCLHRQTLLSLAPRLLNRRFGSGSARLLLRSGLLEEGVRGYHRGRLGRAELTEVRAVCLQ
jgi:hypothetical protein